MISNKTGWRLVHNGVMAITLIDATGIKSETVSQHIIEVFDTVEEAEARIDQLGLIVEPDFIYE